MSRVIRIPVEGEPYEDDVDLTYPAITKIVDGGYFERVVVNPDAAHMLNVTQQDIDLIVDEEGLVKHLPLNFVASPFYASSLRRGVICGPATLVGRTFNADGEDDWTDVPDGITAADVLAVGLSLVRP